MRLPVVVYAAFILRDRYLHTDRLDLQLLVYYYELYIFKVRIRVLEVRCHDTHVILPGIGLRHCPGCRLRLLHGGAHIVQLIVCFHGCIPTDGMRLPVVVNTAIILGNRHYHLIGYRLYLQRASFRDDVIVGCFCSFIQRVGEIILAASYLCLAARDVIRCAFACRESVTAHGHFIVRQCLAIVHLLVSCARQRDCTLADLQRSVHDHKLDVAEVLIRVREVRRLQLHVVSARVSALHCRVAVEREVRFCIQFVIDRYRISGHRLLGSVILLATAVLRNRYCHLVGQLRYFQRAFCLGDLVVVCLCAFVQRIGERIRASPYRCLAACYSIRCAFACRESVTAHGHFIVRQCLAIVHLLVSCARQRDCTLADLQRSVHDHKLDVAEVLIRVREVRRLQLHVVSARVSALHCRVAVEREVRFCIQFVIDRYRISGHRLLGSVILLATAVLRNRYCHLVGQLRYFQRAFCLGDLVVVCLCAFVQRIGERIRASPHLCLAARDVIRCAFAFRESVTAYSHFIVRQRRPVIFLRRVACLQRDRTLFYAQVAVFVFSLRITRVMGYRPCEGVVVRFPVTEVLYLRTRCRRDRYHVARAQRRRAGCRFSCYRYQIALFTIRYGVFIFGVICSIVWPAAICRCYLQCLRALRDRQNAKILRDVVIERFFVFIPFDIIAVNALAGLSLRTGNSKSVFSHIAFKDTRYRGPFMICKRGPIILFGRTRGGNRCRLLFNLKAA